MNIYLNTHQFEPCAPLIRLEGNNPIVNTFKEAPICAFCQKPIEDTPVIEDLDLKLFFCYACSEKDEVINKLWEG